MSETPNTPPDGSTPPPSVPLGTPDPADVEKNKVYAILAYIGILFVVPLIVAKDSPFAKFHTNQGLVLFICMFALGIIAIIPILGWIVGCVGYIAILVFAIMGIISAASGKMTPLPIIGKYKLLK